MEGVGAGLDVIHIAHECTFCGSGSIVYGPNFIEPCEYCGADTLTH